MKLPEIGEVWRYAIHETVLLLRENGEKGKHYHFNYQTGETKEVIVTKENIKNITDELDFHSYRFVRKQN